MYHNALIIVATCWKLDLEVWVQSASYMFYRYIPGLDRKSGQPSWMPQNSRNCRNIAEMPDFLKTLLLLQFLFDHSEFLAPLTTSAQRSWWYYWLSVVRRRPSVNFCFKSLLLLQFLFDHSEFFTGETRHIVPPCNKAGISNFCLEFQKLQKFQISWKRYSSYSSYSKILNFLLEKLGI